MDFLSYNTVAMLAFPSGESHPRLTRRILVELAESLAAIQRDGLFEGVVIAANSESFATGADIEEISLLSGVAARNFARAGQELFDAIENYPLPVVAAIRGFCLGGGLDLALACHARVATYDSSFGHPGGSLGLMTGWGGTQRLPSLIGKADALAMLLTGERVPATQALTLGLVDELVAGQELIESAVRRVHQMAAEARYAKARMLRV